MILGILQARMSSSRLPGKVLKPILGQPMLLRHIERLNRVRLIDKLVVATSIEDSDDPIEHLCLNNGIDCFRGSLNDVLDRYCQTARKYMPEHVVRLTGDCPLADPTVIDNTIAYYLQGKFDYVANSLHPTFPHGLDVEIMRFSALEKAWQEAKLPSHREHVTMFIYQNPLLFTIGEYKNNVDISDLRWTVDEPEDFIFVTAVFEALYSANPNFLTEDILRLIEKHPYLREINSMHSRHKGQKIFTKQGIK